MYIHTTSMLQPKNNILNIGSINRSIQHQTNPISKKANQDRISISPQGKMMQMIDKLNKQKESIIQHKNEVHQSIHRKWHRRRNDKSNDRCIRTTNQRY